MSFIYHISDKNKSIEFKGKRYNTPCSIYVKSVSEIKMLRSTLTKKGIKKVKAERSNKQTRLKKIIPLGIGDGVVSLNAVIRN